MIIRNANVLRGHAFEQEPVYIEGDRFARAGGGEVLDASGLYALPGLVDIHTHGCMRHDFCDGSAAAIGAIADYSSQHGVTAISPATMTLPEEQLLTVCHAAADWRAAARPGAMLAGITMEGPFFSAAKKGAQNAAFLLQPDLGLYHRLQRASGGLIKVACVAPELPGATEFIAQVSAGGCRVSIAHTTADYDTAVRAAQAGASHVTHLFNAMPPFAHRDPGVVGAAFDRGMTVELVCDGIHLHPTVVRAAVAMFGVQRIVLVSDSMMATGLGDGEYELGGQAVQVRDKHALLRDGTIAGSAYNLLDCLRTAVSFGIPLPNAVRMASENPARVIGCLGDMGSIEPGKLANLTLLSDSLEIVAVYIGGRRV